MQFYLNRRSFLATSSVMTVAATMPLFAATKAGTKEQVRRIVDRSIVINGNMLPGFSDPVDDPKFIADVKATGITAIKLSMGGGKANFSDTVDHIGHVNKAIAEHSHVYTLVRKIDDLMIAKRAGKVGIFYAFEDAGMLEGKVERINYFRDLGVRSMQLSYNGVSPFASGVMSPNPSLGLTDLGREAVVTMNATGVTIDASHSDDKSTLDIIDQSSRPVMISHGGCDGINPHPRNKSYAVLKAIADQGGVFGLYELAYLTPGLEQQNLTDYMQHLIHALNICGEDHVGIGSDAFMLQFDTSPESMKHWNQSIEERKEAGIAAPGEGPPPFVEGLNVPERAYLIAEKLIESGYSEAVVEKVLGANFLRVFKETWR